MGSKLAMEKLAAAIVLVFVLTADSFALAPAAASAEGVDDSLRKDFPKPRDNPALIQWRDGRDWGYNTEYLFGITRGLSDQNIPRWCEAATWFVTVPLDIANLPFTALAGLFGD